MIATGTGILCPRCKSGEHEVVDSRPGPGYIRRRRKCKAAECRLRFSSIEISVSQTRYDNAEPVMRAMRLQDTLDRMPTHRRQIVLSLIAELEALEARTE